MKKSKKTQDMIDQAVAAMHAFGVPLQGLSPRRAERMAMAFMAVAQVNPKTGWVKAQDLNDHVRMKTRDIIRYVNAHFQENISPGSYDDIRRKDLKYLVLGDIVVRTHPTAARNDSNRGYALNPRYTGLVKKIGSTHWKRRAQQFMSGKKKMSDVLSPERKIPMIPIILPSGKKLKFSPGEHNLLQKKIIEEFLPRYGFGAEVLYIGDTADKFLFLDESKLQDLEFFELSHGELPDVVAYSPRKKWLYLIEAVHSSGPMSDTRILELKKLTKKCKASIVFVTAFLTRETFRKFVKDVAWETEVWIADAPDHLIHFNGDKFLGPYAK